MAKIKTTHGSGNMVKIWIAIGVTFALVAAVLIAYQLGRGTSDTEADPAPSTRTEPANSTDGEQREPLEVANYSDWEVEPDRYAVLPSAETSVDGLPVGFPETELGAVAYVVAAHEATATHQVTDLERAVAAYYSNEERFGQSASQSVAQLEATWQEAAAEQGADGAEIQSTVYGFSVVTSGEVVYVSKAYTIQFGGGDRSYSISENLAETVGVRWLDGRWEFALQDEGDPSIFDSAPTQADPGTSDFNLAGWTAIERDGR